MFSGNYDTIKIGPATTGAEMSFFRIRIFTTHINGPF